MPKKSEGKKIRFWVVSCGWAEGKCGCVWDKNYPLFVDAKHAIMDCKIYHWCRADCDAQIHKCEVVRD